MHSSNITRSQVTASIPHEIDSYTGKVRIDPSAITHIVSQTRWETLHLSDVSPEKQGLLQHFQKNIIWQEQACEEVADRIDIWLHRMLQPGWPLAIIPLFWPTGVWKTQFARCTAEFFFGDSWDFTKIAGEEHQQSHTDRNIFWAPKSYIGYGDSTPLSSKNLFRYYDKKKNTPLLQNRPNFSILLLDEIEKFHPSIIQSFLWILDTWKVELTNNDSVDLTNTIIFITSNAGEAEASNRKPIWFYAHEDHDDEDIRDRAISQTFSPEFRSRMGSPIRLKNLSPNDCIGIIHKKIQDTNKVLQDYYISWNVHIWISDSAVDFLVKHWFNKKQWARPIEHVYKKFVSRKIDRVLGELKDSPVLYRRNPTILFFDYHEQSDDMTVQLFSPEIQKGSHFIQATPYQYTPTTIDLVNRILSQSEKVTSYITELTKDGFDKNAIVLFSTLDHQKILETISIFELWGKWSINVYGEHPDAFENFQLRDIGRIILNIARQIFQNDNYSKHIFILRVIARGILVIQELIWRETLNEIQKNIIVQMSVSSALKIWK